MVNKENKRIALNTIALYIRMFATLLVGLYTSRVLLEILGVIDFGVYNVVCGLVMMFSFVNATLSTGTQRFLNIAMGYGDEEKVKNVFNTAFYLHLILAFIIILLLETLGLWFLYHKLVIPVEKIYDAFWIFQFSVIVCALQITQVPYTACLVAHEEMRIYAYIGVWDAFSKLLIAFLLYILNRNHLIFYGLFLMIQQIFTILIYRVYCIQNFKESHICRNFDRKEAKQMITFSGWNIIGCMAVTLNGQGVNILLNMFFGPVINAARAISMQIYNAATQFAGNFQTAVNPQIIKLYAQKEYNEMHSLICNNVKYATFLILILIIPIIVEIDFILYIWLGDNIPHYTAVFSQIILLQCLITTLSRPLIIAIHAIGKLQTYSLVSGSVLLLILPLAYFLLKMDISVILVCVVCIFPWLFELIFCVYYVNNHIGQSAIYFFKYVILKTLAICLIASLGFIIIHILMDFGWVRFISVFVIGELWMFLIIYKLGINNDMRRVINLKLRTVVRRFVI